MGKCLVIAMFILSGIGLACGQQTGPSTQSPTPDEQPARVKVYAVGQGVTAPKLLPNSLSLSTTGKCRTKVDGTVALSVLVDATGLPRNLMFLHPLGNDLDRMALRIVGEDRFSPGTFDGAPVVVGQSVDVSMQACAIETEDNAGKKKTLLRLRSQPVQTFGKLPHSPEETVLTSEPKSMQELVDKALPFNFKKLGGGVAAPVPLNHVEAMFTDEARRARYAGTCWISMIVDTQGLPQNMQVVRPLEYGLTENALDAVYKYRFTPAMRSDEPVPVKITVEVNFMFVDSRR